MTLKTSDEYAADILPIVKPEFYYVSSGSNRCGSLSAVKSKRNPKERSKTFSGIANAMAEQWG